MMSQEWVQKGPQRPSPGKPHSQDNLWEVLAGGWWGQSGPGQDPWRVSVGAAGRDVAALIPSRQLVL